MEITPEERERLVDLEMARFRAELRAKEGAARLAAADAALQASAQAALEETQPAAKVEPPLILGIRRILAVLIMAGIGAAVFLFLTTGNSTSSTNSRFSEVKQPIAVGRTVIPAHGYIDYKIEIVPGMQEAVVAGAFKVSGDPGAGITSALTDADEHANWVNGRKARSIWQMYTPSASGTIAEHLGPGTYYLVFSNRLPPPSDKQVVLDVSLNYRSATPGGQDVR